MAGVLFLFTTHFLPCKPLSSVSACHSDRVMEELLLSSFSTRYSEEKESRSRNIRLACQLIDGCRIDGGESFSFNERVGERTRERGFEEAPVILNGEFVSGVGGGVCQVSTTVYNGALLAGMGITEVHPHSLKVGYVPPSFDAMVSSRCDLKFTNSARTPVVIAAKAEKGVLTVAFYGKGNGFTYRTESVTVAVVPPPEPKVLEAEEEGTPRAGKDGLRSEGYLISVRHGKEKKRERIRRDFYSPVQAVEKKCPESEKEGAEGEIFDNKFEEFTENN